MLGLCRAVQWMVCTAVLLGKGTCHSLLPQSWAPATALLMLVERAGTALEVTEALLLSLFSSVFLFVWKVVQPTAAGVCEGAWATLEKPVFIPVRGCTGLTGL